MSTNESKPRREAKSKPEEVKKQRILMLHGYRQSEMAFRERSGGLRKALKSQCEFIFCEAPHLVPKSTVEQIDEQEASNEIERGWWFSADDDSYNALDVTECDKGFDKSLEYLNEIFRQHEPIDGILGFSQGGCLAGILCSIAEQNKKNEGQSKYGSIKFKYCLIVAGFVSQQVNHATYYNMEKPIELPTLHIYGKADKVIPYEMPIKLTGYFKEPKSFLHELGHFIPVNSESKNAILEFLKSNA